ncbi:MAG: PEP-CTERM sorting domain-containing protein [Bryobacteraceae bacterium]
MSIDWEPLGGGTGSFEVGSGTTLTYDAGTPVAQFDDGVIRDLPPATPGAGGIGFMTFVTHAGLSFDLTGLGPGSGNTNCATAVLNGQSCSVFPGSPFVLTADGFGNSTVTLRAFGKATDNTPAPSYWIGSFTTQIGLTPLQIQQRILRRGPGCVPNPNFTLQSSYSGRFTATTIPEPGTAAMIGLAFLGVGLLRRRWA